MATITFTIPDAKLPRLVAAVVGLHTKPTGYTDNQWAKEYFRRLMIRETLTWEKHIADATIQPDDGLVS